VSVIVQCWSLTRLTDLPVRQALIGAANLMKLLTDLNINCASQLYLTRWRLWSIRAK